MSILLIILLAILLLAFVFIAIIRSRRRHSCDICQDGWRMVDLTEFGVFGTAQCFHCSGCDSYYVIEATSPEIRKISRKKAKRNYRSR